MIFCLQNYSDSTYSNAHWFESIHAEHDINLLNLSGRYRYDLI